MTPIQERHIRLATGVAMEFAAPGSWKPLAVIVRDALAEERAASIEEAAAKLEALEPPEFMRTDESYVEVRTGFYNARRLGVAAIRAMKGATT